MIRRQQQGQTAGANAQQIQVAGDLVVQGVTEERAREIAQETAQAVIAEYTEEANEEGLRRISSFDEKLIRELSKVEGLGAFADPGFQIALKKAQIGAASTERESDHEMLARLLRDRAERGGDRAVRAGIERAVQVIDQVDDAALCALTVLLAVHDFSPRAGLVGQGLETMNRLFAQLLECDLPSGQEWMDHLDILDAVRISQVATLKKFAEYYPAQHLVGYVAAGVEADSEAERVGKQRCLDAGVNLTSVDHELRPGFRRMPFVSVAALQTEVDSSVASGVMTQEQASIVVAVAHDVYGLGRVESSLVPELMRRVDELPHLSQVRRWWDGIPSGVQVTAVGRVLGRANARRLDENNIVPDLH